MRLPFLLMIATVSAMAQQQTVFERMIQPKVSLQTAWLGDAKIGSYNGSVRTSKARLQVNNGFGGIAYTRWYFDWHEAHALPFYRGKTPIDNMQQFKLYGNLYRRLSDKWSMLTMLNANATFEKELDGSAVGAGLLGFFSYRFDGEHALQVGAFVNYHPVTTLALPVVGYSYRARAEDGFVAVIGFPRAFAGYHVDEGLLLRTGFIYSQAVIRLADDSGIEPAGYVEASDYQASAGIRAQIATAWEVSADLLYAFRREMHIYDHNAHLVDTYSIKPSPGVMFKMTYAFE